MFHRIRDSLIVAGAILIVTIVVYAGVSGRLKDQVVRDTEARVSRAQFLIQQVARLEGLDAANLVARSARKPSVVAVFDKAGEAGLREAAFAECEAQNAALAKENNKADIVAVLDSTGKVVARDLNPNAMYGEDLRSKFPAVAEALKGKAVTDVWELGGRVTQVALAPITRPDNTTVGALLVGYVVSANLAQAKADLLGVQIGFFHAGRAITSSFIAAEDAQSKKEDVTRTQALTALLFGGAKPAEAALQKGVASEVFRGKIEGEEYAAVVGPLPGSFADRASGVVALASITQGLAAASGVGGRVFVLGILALLIGLLGVYLTTQRFARPLDKVELGVAEIINGNIDYQFKPVGADFEGLSNSLNVMLTRLLGREEASDEEGADEETEARQWKAAQMIIEEGDGAASAAGEALARETDAAYYPRLFNDYAAALAGAGQPAEGLSVLAFMAKLRLVEAGLKSKWSCKAVRFQIVRRGSDIVFQAVRIG